MVDHSKSNLHQLSKRDLDSSNYRVMKDENYSPRVKEIKYAIMVQAGKEFIVKDNLLPLDNLTDKSLTSDFNYNHL